MTAKELLPIGTRVTHFDGGPTTHGKGTIIAYNGVAPSPYLKSNFKEAVELAGDAGLLGGVVAGMYDGTRCPYVVHFDVARGDTDHDREMREKYPRGYRDVYERDSVKPLHDGLNIFPHSWDRVMFRMWISRINSWSPWQIGTIETYQENIDHPVLKDYWQFCVRELPAVSTPRNSPRDGSFVPLMVTTERADPEGYYPPLGIFVEYEVLGKEGTLLKGMTGQLGSMGPLLKCETVFINMSNGEKDCLEVGLISKWRELVNTSDFSPSMLAYLK